MFITVTHSVIFCSSRYLTMNDNFCITIFCCYLRELLINHVPKIRVLQPMLTLIWYPVQQCSMKFHIGRSISNDYNRMYWDMHWIRVSKLTILYRVGEVLYCYEV